jgi:hypothetical protein
MPSKEYELLSARMRDMEEKQRVRIARLEETVPKMDAVMQENTELKNRVSLLEADKASLEQHVKRYEKYDGIEASLKEIIVPFVEEVVARHGITPSSNPAKDVTVDQTRLTIRSKQTPKEVGPIDDAELKGKILAVLPEERKWFNTKKVCELLGEAPYYLQMHDAPVSEELNKMVDDGWLAKRRNANRTVDYRLPDLVTVVR